MDIFFVLFFERYKVLGFILYLLFIMWFTFFFFYFCICFRKVWICGYMFFVIFIVLYVVSLIFVIYLFLRFIKVYLLGGGVDIVFLKLLKWFRYWRMVFEGVYIVFGLCLRIGGGVSVEFFIMFCSSFFIMF